MTHRHDAGRNIRWKRAADRHGGSLSALILQSGQDLAGIGARYARAANRHGERRLRIRSVHQSETYIKYPTDVRLQGNGAAVQRLYNAADVIHINNHPAPYRRFDKGQRKPVLYEHHGTIFRNSPREHLNFARKHQWLSAVSTIDLLRFAPDELHWLPTAYDLDELARLRRAAKRADDGIIRVAHAPTNRGIKSTDALIEAVDTLRAEGLPVELELIEHATWAECLRRKAAADIYFDQVILGYGCNAIEAWGMGMPVIAGADEWTLNRMRAEFGGGLPFYMATEATIADALRVLVTSAEARAEWALRGMAHAERFHAEIPALERLVDLYQRAIALRPAQAAVA